MLLICVLGTYGDRMIFKYVVNIRSGVWEEGIGSRLWLEIFV